MELEKEMLRLCMSNGFFLDKEALALLSSLGKERSEEIIREIALNKIKEKVVTRAILNSFFPLIKNSLELNKNSSISTEDLSKKESLGQESSFGKAKILSAPAFPQRKIEVRDFVSHFRSRYEAIRAKFEKRDFENLTTLKRIGQNKGTYVIVAMIVEKRTTKNKNLLIEVEDLTGKASVLINQNKKELFEKAKDLLLDDIVALDVSGTSEMLFVNDLFYPEAVLQEKRYGANEEYIAVVGDMHVGSKMFLEKNLLKFIKWVNGEEGNEEQRVLGRKVRYLFFTGDNVDGVNHMPGQEPLLNIKTTKGQYGKLEEILKLVRKDVTMVMMPGQHDAVWVGEPQPIVSEKYAEGLHKIKNLLLVPNPAVVEIDDGFKVLMYHGASINSFIEEIPEIRVNHGHNNPTRVVKEMIKRSHLAPIHGLMDYIPCEKDPLVIDIIPDIIITGDQHRPEVAIKNNILMIAGSCFQSITPFEERVGNSPDPCKIPLFNMKTREVKILDFSDNSKGIIWDQNPELKCDLENGK